MRFSRLRSGERLALAGAVALAVLLGLNWWFLRMPEAVVGQHESGIRSLGWFAAAILVVTIATALLNAFFTLAHRATAWPIVLSVLTFVLGIVATLTILFRLVFQPGLGVGATDEQVEIELWAWLGFLAAAAIGGGGWIAILDERTDSEEAIEQTDEALRARGDNPRPAPPASAAVPSES